MKATEGGMAEGGQRDECSTPVIIDKMIKKKGGGTFFNTQNV